MRTLLLLCLCAMTVSYAAAQAPSLTAPPQFIYIDDDAITVGLDIGEHAAHHVSLPGAGSKPIIAPASRARATVWSTDPLS